jgi:hypothetical protein
MPPSKDLPSTHTSSEKKKNHQLISQNFTLEKMLSTFLFISLLASVSAFAPLANKAAGLSKMRMSYENEVGVLPPTGFFDPLGSHS